MTEIEIVRSTAKEAHIVTQLGAPAEPVKSEPPEPADGATPIDYGSLLEPVAEEDKPKRKGRGPSPHYVGLINAYLEKEKSGAAEEFKIDLNGFRAVTGKPKLSLASFRQAIRNNLHSMTDDDGRKLSETIQLSVDTKAEMATLRRRKPKPGKD